LISEKVGNLEIIRVLVVQLIKSIGVTCFTLSHNIGLDTILDFFDD